MPDVFEGLPRNHFSAVLCDPPWKFKSWTPKGGGHGLPEYPTMHWTDLASLPVKTLCTDDAVMFMWITWPHLKDALRLLEAWGFEYKTCAFSWIKANASQIDMFRDDSDVQVGMGYWTRANSEVCLLAVRGKPKRLNADVRQGIVEPRREHSRKPDCVYGRIERLVAGPYLELFARNEREGWTSWGNQTDKFKAVI